jgi:hypothetical protein
MGGLVFLFRKGLRSFSKEKSLIIDLPWEGKLIWLQRNQIQEIWKLPMS